jgi:hypothetical protein
MIVSVKLVTEVQGVTFRSPDVSVIDCPRPHLSASSAERDRPTEELDAKWARIGTGPSSCRLTELVASFYVDAHCRPSVFSFWFYGLEHSNGRPLQLLNCFGFRFT